MIRWVINTKPFSDDDCSHTCLAYCLADVKYFGVRSESGNHIVLILHVEKTTPCHV